MRFLKSEIDISIYELLRSFCLQETCWLEFKAKCVQCSLSLSTDIIMNMLIGAISTRHIHYYL